MESNCSRHWIFQEHNIFLPIKEVRTMNFISEVDKLLNTSWRKRHIIGGLAATVMTVKTNEEGEDDEQY